MLQDYIVLDDVISENQANFIESAVKGVKYGYLHNVTNNEDLSVYQPGFVHYIFGDDQILSDLFGLTAGLTFQFADRAGLNFSKLKYTRLYLQLPVLVNNQATAMHRDIIDDHIIFLYYVNDTEGPTVIYNKVSNYDTDVKILTEVHPRKGRGLFFNGKYFHSATPPKTTSRFVINVTLV